MDDNLFYLRNLTTGKIHIEGVNVNPDENGNSSLEEEINKTLDENLEQGATSSNCSVGIPSFQTPILISGPSNAILGKYINSYTPDLFRQCWLVPGINIPDICPAIVINSQTFSFLQSLIDTKAIKGFLYFGFSSNIYTNFLVENNGRRVQEFIQEDYLSFLQSFKNNLFTENYGNFDGFPYFFSKKYPSFTLMNQLFKFIYEIQRYHTASLIGKIPCNYRMPWDASLLCQNKIQTINDLEFTFSISLMNNVYQIYNQWNSGGLKGLNGTFIDFFIFYQNFFKVLDIAKEVFSDVVLEFSYTITKKEYCRKPYMTIQNLNNCKELYKIYRENKIRLQANP